MYTNPLLNTLSSPTSCQNTSNASAPYVSPTYRSSIFNHTQSFTPTGREARHAINPLGSVFRENNDNLNKGNARAVFDVRKIINEEYQRDMANVDRKKQEAIQRKKPTSDDIKSFEVFQTDYQKMMLRRKTDIRNEKVNYGKELVIQMEERSRRRTLEIQEMKELGQKVHGLSLSMNASPAREIYSSVGARRRETSQGKTEESGAITPMKNARTFESQNSSRTSERSKEIRRTQLPYSNSVVAQTVRGQGSLERILNKAMRSPKGNSTERRPILDKDRSPNRNLTQSMQVKAEKPSQARVQSAKKVGSRDQRPPSVEKTPVKRQQENKNGDNFNPLLKDKPVTVNKNTRMRRSVTNPANQQQDDLEQMQAGPEIEYDREAVNYLRKKKLEQISRLTGAIGKQSEVILDVIDEDPSLQYNDEDLDEGQISISSKRHQNDGKDENYAPRIMDLKGFFGSKTSGTEARTLESDRAKENPDSLSRRDSNSDNTEQKDILEALMEKRKDLLSYLRGLKGRLSYTANKRENQKEYGKSENQIPSKNSKIQQKKGESTLARQKLSQQGKSTTVKPINELIMAQILVRQRATETEKKAKMEESVESDEKSEKYKGYEPSHGSTDVFNKQMKILQQYKKNMKFLGYPENYSSAGQSSKMI